MNGARRVLIFCLLTAVLPTILIIIPLYLRNNVFSDVYYEVSESDVLEIEDISTVFCQEHTIKMNFSFNAYQLTRKPEVIKPRKHTRLKKSMILPDDTMEYWGFFLPQQSHVNLFVCSRYSGAQVLLVRGDRKLQTCDLMKRLGQSNENAQIVPEHSTPSSPKRPGRSTDIDEDNDAAENLNDDGLETFRIVSGLARKIVEAKEKSPDKLVTFEETLLGHKLRHSRSRSSRHSEKSEPIRKSEHHNRSPRNVGHLNNEKVLHGGDAGSPKNDISDDSSEESSYENDLRACYKGKILMKWSFQPSELCNETYLDANLTGSGNLTYSFSEAGYYYYIFYSDNDLANNSIHAVFDVHKPTYQFDNVTKKCLNETTCSFPVDFLSNEIVVLEVLSSEGLENEEDSLSSVISVCQPRMGVYIIFPILVLILILGCAFL